MSRSRLAVVLALSSGLAACRYTYSLPDDAQVTCAAGGAPCPPGWECADALGRCVPEGTPVIAEVHVNTTLPLQTSESGAAVAMAVTLGAPPTAIVRVPIHSTAVAEALPIPAELDFTTDNWNIPQTVTVQGIADHRVDGAQPYEIVLGPPESEDARYSALPALNIPGTNADQDTAQIVVSPSSVRTSETAGPPVPVLVSLSSMPSAPVTIPISSSLPGEVSVAPSSITFQPAQWSTPMVVLLTGLDDAVADGVKSYTIDLGPAASADLHFNGGTAGVTGQNDDNESPGVEVIPTGGLHTNEARTMQDSFAVRLRTPPIAPVSITFQSATPSEANLGLPPQLTLTFDNTNWSTNQVVSVFGVDDSVADGDKPFVIHSDNAVSTDPAYSNYDVPEVNGINSDNDTARVISQTFVPTFSEYGGGQGQYGVRLGSPPNGSVTINIHNPRPDRAVLAPASVTLTTANWQAGAGFTLVPTDNQVRDDDATFNLTFDAAIAPQDPAYAGLIATAVSATVFDDERVIFVTTDMVMGDMEGQTPDYWCTRQDPGDGRGELFHPPKAMIAGKPPGAGANRRASLMPYLGDGQEDWVLQAGLQYLSKQRNGLVIARANERNLLPIEPPDQLSAPLSPTYNIWTGMLSNWVSRDTCVDWSSSGSMELGQSGKGGGLDGVGLSFEATSCSTRQPIVCVEQ